MTSVQLDPVDLRLLDLLSSQSRLDIGDLGSRLGLSAAQTRQRLEALEVAGIFQGIRPVFQARPLGLDVTAFLLLTLEDQRSLSFVESEIVIESQIQEVHRLASEADFLLKILTPSTESLDALLGRLHRIPGILRSRIFVSLASPKVTTALPLSHLAASVPPLPTASYPSFSPSDEPPPRPSHSHHPGPISSAASPAAIGLANQVRPSFQPPLITPSISSGYDSSPAETTPSSEALLASDVPKIRPEASPEYLRSVFRATMEFPRAVVEPKSLVDDLPKDAVDETRLAADIKAAEEARLAAEVKALAEAKAAEEARLATEAKALAEAKAAEEARLAAEAKALAEAKAAEEARLAAEAKALAEAKAAEEARLAAEAKALAEAKAAEKSKSFDSLPRSEEKAGSQPLNKGADSKGADALRSGAGLKTVSSSLEKAVLPEKKTPKIGSSLSASKSGSTDKTTIRPASSLKKEGSSTPTPSDKTKTALLASPLTTTSNVQDLIFSDLSVDLPLDALGLPVDKGAKATQEDLPAVPPTPPEAPGKKDAPKMPAAVSPLDLSSKPKPAGLSLKDPSPALPSLSVNLQATRPAEKAVPSDPALSLISITEDDSDPQTLVSAAPKRSALSKLPEPPPLPPSFVPPPLPGNLPPLPGLKPLPGLQRTPISEEERAERTMSGPLSGQSRFLLENSVLSDLKEDIDPIFEEMMGSLREEEMPMAEILVGLKRMFWLPLRETLQQTATENILTFLHSLDLSPIRRAIRETAQEVVEIMAKIYDHELQQILSSHPQAAENLALYRLTSERKERILGNVRNPFREFVERLETMDVSRESMLHLLHNDIVLPMSHLRPFFSGLVKERLDGMEEAQGIHSAWEILLDALRMGLMECQEEAPDAVQDVLQAMEQFLSQFEPTYSAILNRILELWETHLLPPLQALASSLRSP